MEQYKKRKPNEDYGRAKKPKSELTKESFLRSLKGLKLYTEEDRYYSKLSIDRKPLELRWD